MLREMQDNESHPISARIATHHLLEASLRVALPWVAVVGGSLHTI
jgi:hypothetical protein